jgi:hypothetical protein
LQCSARLTVYEPGSPEFAFPSEVQCPACGCKSAWTPPSIEALGDAPPRDSSAISTTAAPAESGFAAGAGMGLLLLAATALGWCLRHWLG